MQNNEVAAWLKLIVTLVLFFGVPVFIAVINANYKGDSKEKKE